MSYALYVTHPEVVRDPEVPVPQWGLSEEGWKRARAFAGHPLLASVKRQFSSSEKKALDLAGAIAEVTGAEITADAAFGENDRSSTGYVSQERFEAMAARFFGEPDTSADGWETARAAQSRVVNAVKAALASLDPHRPILFCGHGAVGTLLKCHLAGRPIALSEDQRIVAHPGGGNVLLFRLSDLRLFGDWQAMEDLPDGLPF